MGSNGHIKKELFLQALEKSLGIVTTACRATDTPRSTYYKWIKDDKEFSKSVSEIENIALDFGESKLHELMSSGNASSVIFFLKTKGKGRGYIEKQELDITSGNEPITIELNLNENKTGPIRETENSV